MIQRILPVVLTILYSHNLVWADDWPQWRGPDRNDISKETGLLPSWPANGPKLLWTFRGAGSGYSNVVIVGDRLYSLGSDDDKEFAFAIDLKTRKKLWSTEVGGLDSDGPYSTPAVDGGFLYAIGVRGNLVCVETATGRKVWCQGLIKQMGGRSTSYGFCESVLVDGDQVIAKPSGKKVTVAAFDKKTGRLKWRNLISNAGPSYSSMIAIQAGNVRQYVAILGSGGYSDVVRGVRASDGKLLWQFPFHGAIGTPIYQNDYVYMCAGYREGCKLVKLVTDREEFKVEHLYTNKEMQNHYGSVVLVDGYVYGYCDQNGWLCQEFMTGKKVWNKKLNLGKGTPTYADSNLYCYHDRGDVLLFRATHSGYQEQGRFHVPEDSKQLPPGHDRHWTRPVIANGKLYLRDQDLIFCYDIRKP